MIYMGVKVVAGEAVSGLFGTYDGRFLEFVTGVCGLKIFHTRALLDISFHGTTTHMNLGKIFSIQTESQILSVILVVVAVGVIRHSM